MNRFAIVVMVLLAALGGFACSDDPRKDNAIVVPEPDAGPIEDVPAPEPDTAPEPDVPNPEPDAPDAEPDVVEPEVLDRDGDGILNEDELEAGTDPDNRDSDEDGFWDGWELAEGTDPNNPESRPMFTLPEGPAYVLRLTNILEPALLKPLLGGRLGSLPPILVFAEGLTDGDNDTVRLRGGIGEQIDDGPDEMPGTVDDRYGMSFASISQLNGQFLIDFEGTVVDRAVSASSELISLDLTGVSELTDGIQIRVEQVDITAQLNEALEVMQGGSLAGVFTEESIEDLADQFRELFPVDPDILLDQLDADGDGIIPVEFTFEGRVAVVETFIEPEGGDDPLPREPGPCCPDGAEEGMAIDGFLTVEDQGIQADEEALAERAIEALIEDPEVHFVATVRHLDGEPHYFVYSQTGQIEFVRVAGPEGLSFPILAQEGDNPIANTDPTRWGTLEEILGLPGGNPEGTTYPDKGYLSADDDRLVFLSPELMTFPFAYERIASMFDDPRSGDLAVTEVSYTGGGFSSHGQLGAIQSRAPLVMAGPGIRSSANTAPGGDFEVVGFDGDGLDPAARQMLFLQRAARGVDIAPTVAAALGVDPHPLAVREGRFTTDARLAWQDGRILREVFTEDAQDAIDRGEPVAEFALVIINDGLTAIEINYEAVRDGFDVSAYRELYGDGMAFQFGMITNWPSNTYPSHNMIGSGAYAGHHGIMDNSLYERAQAIRYSPLTDLFETERFLGSAHANLPVETIFEAVHRTFGAWDDTPNGTMTASFNDPASRGATFASLERRRPEAMPIPEPASTITVGNQTFDLPTVGADDLGGLVDNATLFNFQAAYNSDVVPPPKAAILNFSSTDTAGHAFGPHGDVEREVVIPRINLRMAILFAILEEAGIRDQTLVLLTSDHGMELKDASRQASAEDNLRATGIKYIRIGANIIFKQMAVDIEGAEGLAEGVPSEVVLTAIDSGTLIGPQPVFVPNATVRVVSGAGPAEAVTDEVGQVELTLTPEEGADTVVLSVESDDFNAETVELSVGQ